MPKMKGAEDGYLVSRGHSYYVFALLFLLYMFDYIDRMVVVSLFPYLKNDFGLSDTECGLLVSTVYWSIVVLSVPISVIIDRWSRKKSIGLMAIFWSLATVACAFTRNFPQLFAARTAIGVGEAGYAPGGTAMISAFFPEKMRSSIVGLWTAALPLGSALGIMLGGYIAARYGWRNAFGIVALPGFVVAVLFLFVRDYRTVKLENKTDAGAHQQAMKTREIVRRFTRTPSLLLTYVAFAGSMFLTAAYLSWLPTYYHRVENLPIENAAFKGSLVMLLAIIGFPLGGFLVDRWRRKKVKARLLFPALSSVFTGAVFLFAFSSLQGAAQYALVLLGGIGASAFSPAAIAVTQDVVHPGLRATSYSFCVLSQNLLGSSLGPLFVGVISDRYGIDYALMLVPIFSFLAAVLYFAASFFYEADLARVEKIPMDVELRFETEAGRA
ncbi:MAG TPA: MFS transporter [Thermodesulfobacteriota bacterium]|nr:MFS transporter [Thermodesulfobacteriota bacterium]